MENLPYNLLASYRSKKEMDFIPTLTSKQYQTLNLLLIFSTAKEIGDYQKISRRTVKGRIGSLLRRLRARDKYEILRMSYLGLIKFRVEGSDEIRTISLRVEEKRCP